MGCGEVLMACVLNNPCFCEICLLVNSTHVNKFTFRIKPSWYKDIKTIIVNVRKNEYTKM